MKPAQKILFISDLHLCEDAPTITHVFLKFLAQLDATVDGLYILGDLFEAWIGDDDSAAYLNNVKHALKTVTQKNIPIYILHGNRDFLIGSRFLKETGCQLLTDETVIHVYQTPVLLMHGDTLCTQDIGYLRTRKIFRNAFVQRIFLCLPLAWRKPLAQSMREKSQQHTSQTSYEIMDVTSDAVETVLQKHAVNYLIHGHTHRPGVHSMIVQGIAKTRSVLGAWHDHGNVLIWDASGKIERLDFTMESNALKWTPSQL